MKEQKHEKISRICKVFDLKVDDTSIKKYYKIKDVAQENQDIIEEILNLKDKINTLNAENSQKMKQFMEDKQIEDDLNDKSEYKNVSDLTYEDYSRAKKLIDQYDLFDYQYYEDHYPWAYEKQEDLLDHYLYEGYKSGYDPSDEFDTNFYINQYEDVKKTGMNPLMFHVLYDLNLNRKMTNHFTDYDINHAIPLIQKEGLFDSEFYLRQAPELSNVEFDLLQHYLKEGYKQGFNPSADFNTSYYMQKYQINENPLLDYVLKNSDVQTKIELDDEIILEVKEKIEEHFDYEYYKKQVSHQDDLVEHYIKEGEMLGYKPRPDFNPRDYAKMYPESSMEPNMFYHHIKKDTEIKKTHDKTIDDQIKVLKESTLFDAKYYMTRYPDVKYTMITPEEHYLKYGYLESKNPSEYFLNNYYMYKYPEVKENPLYHYLTQNINKEYIGEYYFSNVEKHKIHQKITEDISKNPVPKFKDEPSVTIMILNHNGEKYLDLLLESLYQNTTDYSNYEVIVIDNNSSDSSDEIIHKYQKQHSNLKLKQNKINKSFSESYNEAVKDINSEYLIFMDNDIQLTDGWLNELMHTATTHNNTGVIIPRLIYPNMAHMKINREKSYKTQHTGVKFKNIEGYMIPYSHDDGKLYEFNTHQVKQIPAAQGSLIMIRREVFNNIEGFDEEYNYDYEAIDLSLTLDKQGYKNYYNPQSIAYHFNHATRTNMMEALRKSQKQSNNDHFAHKWNKYLKRKVLNDKINKNNFYSENPLHFTFITMETGDNAAVGDYFIAMELASELKKRGFGVDFKSKNSPDAFEINSTDVVISLINSYDINKIKCTNPLLIKIAWILNWPEYWVDKKYFESYDIILTSNSKSLHYIDEHTGYLPILFPQATNPDRFNPEISKSEEYSSDYTFVGNDWHDEREITKILGPINTSYKFNLYGKTWSKYPQFEKYYQGYVPYTKLPQLYASTKIVLDDATDLTSTPSSVNGRVFDALATGTLVITNGEIGVRELFNNKLPVFKDKESLTALLEEYLENPQKRKALVDELRSIVLNYHTYKIRVHQLIDIIKDFVNKTCVIIKIPTPISDNKYQWGDYHVGVQLQKEFNKQDYPARLQLYDYWQTDDDAVYDIVLVLRGVSLYTPKVTHYNIEWNISHPNRISIGEYNTFDKVYIASEYWTSKMRSVVSTDVESLLQCTNPERFHRYYGEDYQSKLLFVGNSRMIYRKILKDLLPSDYKLDIYGNNWEGILDECYIKDNYIPNDELYKAYSTCEVLLNDHWDDMRKMGFISNRIFDGLACGAMIVTDHVKGIEDVFPDSVIYYDTPEELPSKIEEALNRPPVDTNIIEEHTYARRVEKIINDYQKKR